MGCRALPRVGRWSRAVWRANRAGEVCLRWPWRHGAGGEVWRRCCCIECAQLLRGRFWQRLLAAYVSPWPGWCFCVATIQPAARNAYDLADHDSRPTLREQHRLTVKRSRSYSLLPPALVLYFGLPPLTEPARRLAATAPPNSGLHCLELLFHMPLHLTSTTPSLPCLPSSQNSHQQSM
jgi:hypothetical protein